MTSTQPEGDSRHRAPVILIAAVVLGGGCSGTPEGGGARITVRDSAGIEIVESVPPAPGTVAPWVVDSVPVFDIGADQTDPNQEFSFPSNPVRLPDGRIALAEPGTQEIRFFDAGGAWIQSVGRKGEGPGEFTDLGSLFLGPDDSLYAYDRGTGFVTVVDRDGRFGRRARAESPGEGRFAIFTGVFANGHWLVNGRQALRQVAAGVLRSTTALFEYTAGGKVLDSIVSVPGGEFYGEPVGSRGWRSYSLPFARGSVSVVHGSRAFIGVTERVDISVYRSGAGGGLELVVRIRLPALALTREMIERAVDQRAPAGGWPGLDEYRRTILGATYPSHVPAISGLVVAANGDLWFREHVVEEADPVRYVVADSSGRWRAYAVSPARFTPSWIGEDRVIGLWRDPDDVPHIRAYRLAR